MRIRPTPLLPVVVLALLSLLAPRGIQAQRSAELVAASDVENAGLDEGTTEEAEPDLASQLPAEDEAVFEFDEGNDAANGDDTQIEATVEEIEMLISLPRAAQLGREADEDPRSPRNLFETKEVREALLGTKPKFVYFPQGIDPMIIPWVRNQIVVNELLDDVRELMALGDLPSLRRAQEITEEITTKYKDTQQAPEANRLRSQILRQIQILTQTDPERVNQPHATPTPDINPPPRWVIENTRGVIVDKVQPEDSYVLIGDDILRRGDKVPRFPQVVIQDILPGEVIFTYQDNEFLVRVKSEEG
ncbi:hypothetical protein KQI84_03785 [bacterium]|nr:hypothetical protein [bacterium]